MFEIFIAFAIQKPSTDVLRYSFVTSITPIPHSLKPSLASLKISFYVKPTLSRSICHFLLFYNTERLASSVTITPVTTTVIPQNSPRLIRNQHDLDTLLDFLTSQDFPSHLKDQRPNTKWVIERIVSLRIHLVMTSYPLGNPPNLPDYIKNNRYVIALEKDENHAYRYRDHLCFFRCLAIAKFGKT